MPVNSGAAWGSQVGSNLQQVGIHVFQSPSAVTWQTESVTLNVWLDNYQRWGNGPDGQTFTVTGDLQLSTNYTMPDADDVYLPGINAGTTNVARMSGVTATASSYVSGGEPWRAIDGVALGYPQAGASEWESDGERSGAWIQLNFPQPVYVRRIFLIDRPNAIDEIRGGTLLFSDGSTVNVGGLYNEDNDASPVTFAPKLTTSVRFTVTSTSSGTENVGLSEFEVWGSTSASAGHRINVPLVYGQTQTKTITATVTGHRNGVTPQHTRTITIPARPLPPVSIPTLSASVFDMGTPVTIYTNRLADSGRTHTLQWFAGGSNGWIADSSNRVTDNAVWAFPLSVFGPLYPSSGTTSGAYVRCTTYDASGTSLGYADAPFTAVVPATAVPSFTGATVTDTSAGVAETFGQLVRTLSHPRYTFTEALAYPSGGATLAQYRVNFGGTVYTSGTNVVDIPSVTADGTVPVTLSVVDSRGRTTSSSAPVQVKAYSSPTISVFEIRRADQYGTPDTVGEYLLVDLAAQVPSMLDTGSVERNHLTYQVSSRLSGSGGAWSAQAAVPVAGLTVTATPFYTGPFLTSEAYEVVLEVQDAFGTASSQLQILDASLVVMSWGKTGVGIAKMHEQGALDVAGNAHISGATNSGSLAVTGNVTVGGTLGVTGAATFSGGVSFGGQPTVAGSDLVAVPICGIIEYPSLTAPSANFKLCDGTVYNVADYPTAGALLKTMSAVFGGNGTTTFGVPNYGGRTSFGYLASDAEFNAVGKPGGSKTATLAEANMPPHVHTTNLHSAWEVEALGTSTEGAYVAAGDHTGAEETSEAGGSGSPAVAQPFAILPPFITMPRYMRLK